MLKPFNKFLKILDLKGKTTKDTFWITLAKFLFLPKRIFTRSTNIGYFLFRDVIAKTNYGLFFCRKGDTDLGFVSESFESEIVDIFRQCSGTVVDCGAHIGKYAILASKLAEKVIAIEPHPKNYKILTENLKLNNCKNVVPLNLAVWKEDKKLKLFIANDNTEHSLKIDCDKSSIEVEAVKLDTLFEKMKIDKIDWLKIDVEGAEVETLLGAQKFLEDSKISNIVVESHAHLFPGEAYTKKILSILAKNKYSVRKTKNYYIAKRQEQC